MRMVSVPDENPVERAAALADYIREHDPDLVLLQEVTAVREFEVIMPCPVAAKLMPSLPEYGWIRPTGVSRLSGSNPILYRLSRYQPMRQGVVWMSDHPDVPDSRSWGNNIPRYATWAVFYDNNGGEHLFVLNVHLDHLSQNTNVRAVDVLLETVEAEARSLPVVLGGDFNAPPFLATRTRLNDTLPSVLDPAAGPTHLTFPVLQIDGIHHSRDLVSLQSWIDPTPVNGPIGSDHAAVWAELARATEPFSQ